MRRTHQRQVHAVEGQVAAEREQAHPGVAVDVLLADLDEPAAEGQQLHTGPLHGTGERVEHDVDAVAVGVAPDLLGEVGAARVVHMGDPHAAQHVPAFLGAGGRVDLRLRHPGDRDGGLAHAAGGGVDQDLLAGLDVRQVLQSVPGGGRCGGDRGGEIVAQAGRQRDRDVGVDGHEGAPAAVGRHAADMVTDLVRLDIRADRGDDTGEVDTELRGAREARVTPHGHQDVGEVEAGGRDGHLDLAGAGSDPLEGGQFQRLEITGGPDLQTHALAGMVDHRGETLLGPQRARVEVRSVPLVLAEGGLILIGAEQQLLGDELALGGLVDVDLSGAQMRMFRTDHPHQTAQAGLLEVGPLAGEHRLGVAGHHVEPRRLGDLSQLTADAHQMPDVLGAPVTHLLGRATVTRRRDHDDVAEGVLREEGS